MAGVRKVKCPSCGEAVDWVAESLWRPFCSARCKGVDLGAWASDAYRVAGEQPADADALPDGFEH